MNFTILKQSETKSVIIQLCNDGIVRVIGKPQETIDEEQMKLNIKAYNNLIEGKSYAFMYYSLDDTFVFGSDAIKYAKANQHSFPKICIAVVTKSLAQKIVANFYLKISPQLSPLKIFNSISDAENWCYEHIEKAQVVNMCK